MLAAPNSELLAPQDALLHLQQHQKDIPFIQLLKQYDAEIITKALNAGASDAVIQSNEAHLLHVVQREFENLTQRRAKRAFEIALHDSENRCQLLLGSSADAVTYILDGMHIYVNASYVQLFGYANAEELEGVSIIDLIAHDEQSHFKKFLKEFRSSEIVCAFQTQCIDLHGNSFATKMHLSPASYDGERYIQIVVRSETQQQELEEKNTCT